MIVFHSRVSALTPILLSFFHRVGDEISTTWKTLLRRPSSLGVYTTMLQARTKSHSSLIPYRRARLIKQPYGDPLD